MNRVARHSLVTVSRFKISDEDLIFWRVDTLEISPSPVMTGDGFRIHRLQLVFGDAEGKNGNPICGNSSIIILVIKCNITIPIEGIQNHIRLCGLNVANNAIELFTSQGHVLGAN